MHHNDITVTKYIIPPRTSIIGGVVTKTAHLHPRLAWRQSFHQRPLASAKISRGPPPCDHLYHSVNTATTDTTHSSARVPLTCDSITTYLSTPTSSPFSYPATPSKMALSPQMCVQKCPRCRRKLSHGELMLMCLQYQLGGHPGDDAGLQEDSI